jgi:hypothetical protein
MQRLHQVSGIFIVRPNPYINIFGETWIAMKGNRISPYYDFIVRG